MKKKVIISYYYDVCYIQTPLTEAMTKKEDVDSSLMDLQDEIDSASSKLMNASNNFQVDVITSVGKGRVPTYDNYEKQNFANIAIKSVLLH